MIPESLQQWLQAVFDRVIAIFSNLDTSDWFVFGSMLAAFFAAGEAFRNRRISARMYDIAIREKLRTETPLDVYLVDSHILHIRNDQHRIYVFKLLVTNKSAAPNSIKQLSLFLDFTQEKQPSSNLAVEHDYKAHDAIPNIKWEDTLSVPRPIAAGEAISGIALFPVSNVIFERGLIEMYTIRILDAYDRAAERQVSLLKETEC